MAVAFHQSENSESLCCGAAFARPDYDRAMRQGAGEVIYGEGKTAEQIAARRSNVTITVDEGSAATAEDIFTAMLAADQFHTFAEWKRMGYSVKKGAKSAITCQLWKYTDKPGKAVREAAEAAGKDAPETDPHFYMAKAHLFHALQVEKSKR